ncbi:hypothetical protein GCM10011490_04190 [Pseudoclavibacter endophyticus]|uniref:Preprotein translocase subunit YajC n=1 Tax=Pseudoclavibacter endophyticus TaxID=1778590 RepID=A0A6H9WTQ3_9MICO|nr:preprotein translocase subunit YajC [Pseudoclavibacter endophyticus]KAB1650065.1 preprotein translocase subunit YajC [Pseudoclavibacter endophyticus]GGA57563.1 hypothetical protein GCM10011490_04190 [Pseudoclavibacter endophyticus]
MDPMLLIPLLLIAVLLVFMWRGNKKRAVQQQSLREQMVVGAEVMTQAGIYGTIVAQDADNNVTTLETSPGTTLRVHTATVINVLSPTVPDDASALDDDGLPQPAGAAAPADGDALDADDTEAWDDDEREDDLEETDDELGAEFENADDGLDNREADIDPDAIEADEVESANGDDPLGQYRGDDNGPAKA